STEFFFFFFSSRRRHTRCLSDWSSDVCTSDLESGWWEYETSPRMGSRPRTAKKIPPTARRLFRLARQSTKSTAPTSAPDSQNQRSEERRVGKERKRRCGRVQRKTKDEARVSRQ